MKNEETESQVEKKSMPLLFGSAALAGGNVGLLSLLFGSKLGTAGKIAFWSFAASSYLQLSKRVRDAEMKCEPKPDVQLASDSRLEMAKL